MEHTVKGGEPRWIIDMMVWFIWWCAYSKCTIQVGMCSDYRQHRLEASAPAWFGRIWRQMKVSVTLYMTRLTLLQLHPFLHMGQQGELDRGNMWKQDWRNSLSLSPIQCLAAGSRLHSRSQTQWAAKLAMSFGPVSRNQILSFWLLKSARMLSLCASLFMVAACQILTECNHGKWHRFPSSGCQSHSKGCFSIARALLGNVRRANDSRKVQCTRCCQAWLMGSDCNCWRSHIWSCRHSTTAQWRQPSAESETWNPRCSMHCCCTLMYTVHHCTSLYITVHHCTSLYITLNWCLSDVCRLCRGGIAPGTLWRKSSNSEELSRCWMLEAWWREVCHQAWIGCIMLHQCCPGGSGAFSYVFTEAME